MREARLFFRRNNSSRDLDTFPYIFPLPRSHIGRANHRRGNRTGFARVREDILWGDLAAI